MSDHEYMCSLYGVEPDQEDELIDIVLEKETQLLREMEDEISLQAGRLVHFVRLTTDVPAQVVSVEFNKRLSERLDLRRFNTLASELPRDPGSWFVERGFTVRSKTIRGFWHQYAFAASGPQNLTRSEIISYLRDVALLEFDESKVNDCSLPTIIG